MTDLTLTLRNIVHPLDKISGGIPAGSLNLPALQSRIAWWLINSDENGISLC